jgi:hypothetical protein
MVTKKDINASENSYREWPQSLKTLVFMWEHPCWCNTFNRSDSPIKSPVQVRRKTICHTSGVGIRKRSTPIINSRILLSPQGLQLQICSISQVVHTQLKTKTSPILRMDEPTSTAIWCHPARKDTTCFPSYCMSPSCMFMKVYCLQILVPSN